MPAQNPASQSQPLAVIAADMQAVDAAIRSHLYSDVPLVSQVADYIISAGGKRIRPALVLLTANAWGYRGTEHHKLAAVIEFIHTATLLHDDVVDESDLRRGRQTANAAFGNAASVLVGSLAGVLYLRLLARSVGKLGNGSKKVGKLQLLVPVVLVLAAARLPQLELLPALLGFLLYKPALILQAVLDS